MMTTSPWAARKPGHQGSPLPAIDLVIVHREDVERILVFAIRQLAEDLAGAVFAAVVDEHQLFADRDGHARSTRSRSVRSSL